MTPAPQNTVAFLLSGGGQRAGATSSPSPRVPSPLLGLHRCGGAFPDAATTQRAGPAPQPTRNAASTSPPWAASLWKLPAAAIVVAGFSAGAHAASFAPVADTFDPCVDMAPGEARDAWAQWWSGLDCLPPVLAEAPTDARAQPRTQWERLIELHGSGEAVRLLVQPQERPLVVAPAIPLPAAGWLLLTALAGLWAWGRRQ